MRFLLDSSCIVALVSDWQPENARTLLTVNSRVNAGHTMLVTGHAAAESYAVLTRLPSPYKMPPDRVLELLQANPFNKGAEIITLRGRQYRELIEAAALRLLAGGRIYDALMLAYAEAGGADELLTLNMRHFEGLERGRVHVLPP